MKVKQNKISVFLLIIISFFCYIPKTNAITFTTRHPEYGRPAVYCDDYLQYSSTKTKNDNYMKYAVIEGIYRRSYCTNEGESFTSSSYAYKTLDQGYANAQTCSFTHSKGTETGDCSAIIGYIIKTAESKKSNIKEKWMLAQASVWMYLGNFVPQNSVTAGFNIINSPSDNTYPVQYIWQNNKNAEVSTVLYEAWQEYYDEYHGANVIIPDENLITISNETNQFYYHVNNTDSCDSSGYYKTKDITITNNSNQVVKLSINTNDASPVYICDSRNSKCQEDINEQLEIIPNSNIKIYLKSYKYIKNSIKLTVTATYSSGITRKTVYDSVRWNTETSGTQGMAYLTTTEHSADKINKDTDEMIFYQQPMSHKKCADNLKQTSNSIGTKNTPIGRNESLVCAGTNKLGTTYKIDNTTVGDNLTYCTCKTINLGNGRYVNVTITQNVAFKYGNITPTKVYSGGGFELSTEGVTTDYMNTVVWDYADYLGNVPYYYNKNNIEDYDASKIENEIDNSIQKMLEEKLENLEIKFDTYNSNIVNNGQGKTEEYSIKLKENSQEYTISKYSEQKHTYIVDIQKIILKESFFNGEGEVFYEKNDEYIVSGGNKYYIPLYYNQNENNQFIFNISPNTNLTLIDGIDYYIEAECSIGVEYKMPEIRYRTISVSNPFPKGEKTIPSNWIEWWSSTSFQNRIKNTYQTLDYKLELTRENAAIVAEINDKYLYTDWNLINDNGSSDLVNDSKLGFKFKSNISSSYCPIGKSDYIINGRTYTCK